MIEMIQLKYVGGRPNSKEIWDRKRYLFNKENDFICEVPRELEQWLAQFAKGQYQVQQNKTVVKEVIKEVIKEVHTEKSFKCNKCSFVAKNEQGLMVHSHKHIRKGG